MCFQGTRNSSSAISGELRELNAPRSSGLVPSETTTAFRVALRAICREGYSPSGHWEIFIELKITLLTGDHTSKALLLPVRYSPAHACDGIRLDPLRSGFGDGSSSHDEALDLEVLWRGSDEEVVGRGRCFLGSSREL